jgi:hypothetical protein
VRPPSVPSHTADLGMEAEGAGHPVFALASEPASRRRAAMLVTTPKDLELRERPQHRRRRGEAHVLLAAVLPVAAAEREAVAAPLRGVHPPRSPETG